MKIIFLGTNGWYSTKTGNTPCVLVDSNDYYIVFDAGDGIQKLDRYVITEKPIYLFLSHFHLEHIFGFHIFPKFSLRQGIKIYGQIGTEKILKNIVDHPFTATLEELHTRITINELSEGTHFIPFPVTCKFLLHSDPCMGYRIELDGKVVTYCTDTGICDNSLELSRNADILIHECATKAGQYRREWAHTNPREAAELALKANVKQLVLFHFDALIYQSIEERKQAEAEAREIFSNTTSALDDLTVNI